MKGQKRKKNSGFSLVELVVLLAIMGILMAGGITAFGLIFSTSAKETTSKIDSALNKTKVEAMSRASASVEIYKDSTDSSYYVRYTINGTTQNPIKVGSSRVNVAYVDSSGTTTTITGSNNLIISFDRASGGFKPISGTSNYCKSIIVTSGAKTYTITCERLTGKTSIS